MWLKSLSALVFSGFTVIYVGAINESACPRLDPSDPTPSEFTCPELTRPSDRPVKKYIFHVDVSSYVHVDFLAAKIQNSVIAVEIANTLQTMGYANILGVVSDVTSEFSLPVIDAINTWYCHPDIQLSRDKNTTHTTAEPTVNSSDPQYITQLANSSCFPESFKSLVPKEDVKDPVDYYKEILHQHKNVTIVAIGSLTNLNRLYNNLVEENNTKLITDSVVELVVQGGSCNTSDKIHSAGYNLVNDINSAQVLTKWPSLITYLPDNEANLSTVSLEALRSLPKNSPVRLAYDTIVAKNKFRPHDILATYYAIFGLKDFNGSEDLFRYGNSTPTGALQFVNSTRSFWNDSANLMPPRVQRFITLDPSRVAAVNKTLNDLLTCYGKERETCSH